jgi:hypothetical protein
MQISCHIVPYNVPYNNWSLAKAAAPIKPASLPRLALSIEQQESDAL